MEPTVLPNASGLAYLEALIAGDWADADVRPFVNDVDPGADAVVGDFTPPAFTGGAAKAITAWGEPDVTADNRVQAIADLLQWQNTSGSEETVYGIFVRATAGGAFLGYARLDAPLAMEANGNVLAIAIRLSAPRSIPAGSMAQVDE